MPKIILAFFISYIIIFLIRYISLSERLLFKIRDEEDKKKSIKLVASTKKCLTTKYIIFFITCFIFLMLMWYYLSSFCAIFQNSQIYLLKNTFISFGISIIFPIIYNLLPSVFRMYSIKANNENVYKFSTILQLF